MVDAIDDMAKVLETVPLPAFIAASDGGISYGNRALANLIGQQTLTAMDRTLFGLGLFQSPREYRDFLQSFKHGTHTRRLILPSGRPQAQDAPLFLYASRITQGGRPALFGVLSQASQPAPGGGDQRPQSEYSIITRSEAYRRILQQIDRVAATDGTVLITGETGTGKELIARSIHGRSKRASKPLVILNCGALPAELIESELFGYRKGAFTGARNDHAGRFELADEGTLFLDEIGEMPMGLQTRLLRVLQDGEITPLGAQRPVATDVRIIAATNQNLRELIAAGKFRSDLYFRLNVFPIHSIPLRERPEDIPLLVNHFIEKHASLRKGEQPIVEAHDLQRLRNHPFPGNVRELENVIQRALIVTPAGEPLQLLLDDYREEKEEEEESLPLPISASDGEGSVMTFEQAQRSHIEKVLRMTGGKVSGRGGAAKLLNLNPQTLFSKMRRLNIDRDAAL